MSDAKIFSRGLGFRLMVNALCVGCLLSTGWSVTSAADPATTAPPTLDPNDVAARQAILNSPEWKQAVKAFDSWLQVQKIYEKKQLPRVKAEFKRKVRSMNAEQLQDMLADMQAKLKILYSPEAEDARNWLGYFASAKAILPESELKQFDIVNMSPARLQQAVDEVEQKRAALAGQSDAFNRNRHAQVEQAVADARSNADFWRQQSVNRNINSYYPGYQSHIAPKNNLSEPRQGNFAGWGIGFW